MDSSTLKRVESVVESIVESAMDAAFSSMEVALSTFSKLEAISEDRLSGSASGASPRPGVKLFSAKRMSWDTGVVGVVFDLSSLLPLSVTVKMLPSEGDIGLFPVFAYGCRIASPVVFIL